MIKVVLKLDLHDDREKQKALKAVSTLQGIESIAMDMKDKKMTVTGNVDPVDVIAKVRKHWPNADFVSVGPPKKEEPPKKEKKPLTQSPSFGYPYYGPPYCVYNVEENPNSCVIC